MHGIYEYLPTALYPDYINNFYISIEKKTTNGNIGKKVKQTPHKKGYSNMKDTLHHH